MNNIALKELQKEGQILRIIRNLCEFEKLINMEVKISAGPYL